MVFFKKKKKDKKSKNIEVISKGEVQHSNQSLVDSQNNASLIIVENLPLDFAVDYSVLHEIKECSIVARLNELVPAGTKELAHSVQRVKIQNVIESVDTLYTSNIPKESLATAKGSTGGYRGIELGKKGIKENAVLTEFDTSKIVRSGKVAAGVSKVMNVSSLVVGQYYMSEVNTKLIGISKSIKHIGDYQQREFKSRIMALINNVEEISKFSSEILNNDELRKRELDQLNTYKNDTVQLLGQINITIQDTSNEVVQSIKEYKLKVNGFEKLLRYQKLLTSILERISMLIYTLNFGKVSIEKCYSSYSNMTNQSNELLITLPNWHESNQSTLGIDVDNSRFKKQGMEKILSKPLTLVDEKWDYKELDSSFATKIIEQTDYKLVDLNIPNEFFGKDVELILKDGKYYLKSQ